VYLLDVMTLKTKIGMGNNDPFEFDREPRVGSIVQLIQAAGVTMFRVRAMKLRRAPPNGQAEVVVVFDGRPLSKSRALTATERLHTATVIDF